jgi:putative membrane protein insertion efficiency factor
VLGGDDVVATGLADRRPGSLGDAGRLGRAWPRRVVAALLRLYQQVVSPLYPPSCRFYPSCSEYALIAVERHGVVRGARLAAWRLLRCNPWNPGGVDDVPPARVEDAPGPGERGHQH